MSAWRNNLVRRPLSLYEWLVTATNRPSPRVFSLPIAPEIGNSLPSLPFLTVQTDPRLIFRLVFHRNDLIVRRSIDSQMYDTYYIEMISIMASERRQELMHSRISFKRGEQLFLENTRFQVIIILSISMLLIRFVITILTSSFDEGIEFTEYYSLQYKLLETNLWIDHIENGWKEKNYTTIITIIIFWSSTLIKIH